MRERAQACMGMLGIYKCVGNQDHAETCAGMRGSAQTCMRFCVVFCSSTEYWGVLGQGFACICPKKENRQKSSLSYISSYI